MYEKLKMNSFNCMLSRYILCLLVVLFYVNVDNVQAQAATYAVSTQADEDAELQWEEYPENPGILYAIDEGVLFFKSQGGELTNNSDNQLLSSDILDSITEIRLADDSSKISLSENCNALFKNMSNLSKIDLNAFDSSHVVSARYMFENCTSLGNIRLGNWTSNFQDMTGFFKNCHMSSFYTSSLSVASCKNFSEFLSGNDFTFLDISDWSFAYPEELNKDSDNENTDPYPDELRKVYSIDGLLSNCNNLEKLFLPTMFGNHTLNLPKEMYEYYQSEPLTQVKQDDVDALLHDGELYLRDIPRQLLDPIPGDVDGQLGLCQEVIWDFGKTAGWYNGQRYTGYTAVGKYLLQYDNGEEEVVERDIPVDQLVVQPVALQYGPNKIALRYEEDGQVFEEHVVIMCDSKPVYHHHSGNEYALGGCYNAGHSHSVEAGCPYTSKEKSEYMGAVGPGDGYGPTTCPLCGNTLDRWDSGGGYTSYKCRKNTTIYTFHCNKVSRLSCGKTAGVTVDYVIGSAGVEVVELQVKYLDTGLLVGQVPDKKDIEVTLTTKLKFVDGTNTVGTGQLTEREWQLVEPIEPAGPDGGDYLVRYEDEQLGAVEKELHIGIRQPRPVHSELDIDTGEGWLDPYKPVHGTGTGHFGLLVELEVEFDDEGYLPKQGDDIDLDRLAVKIKTEVEYDDGHKELVEYDVDNRKDVIIEPDKILPGVNDYVVKYKEDDKELSKVITIEGLEREEVSRVPDGIVVDLPDGVSVEPGQDPWDLIKDHVFPADRVEYDNGDIIYVPNKEDGPVDADKIVLKGLPLVDGDNELIVRDEDGNEDKVRVFLEFIDGVTVVLDGEERLPVGQTVTKDQLECRYTYSKLINGQVVQGVVSQRPEDVVENFTILMEFGKGNAKHLEEVQEILVVIGDNKVQVVEHESGKEFTSQRTLVGFNKVQPGSSSGNGSGGNGTESDNDDGTDDSNNDSYEFGDGQEIDGSGNGDDNGNDVLQPSGKSKEGLTDIIDGLLGRNKEPEVIPFGQGAIARVKDKLGFADIADALLEDGGKVGDGVGNNKHHGGDGLEVDEEELGDEELEESGEFVLDAVKFVADKRVPLAIRQLLNGLKDAILKLYLRVIKPFWWLWLLLFILLLLYLKRKYDRMKKSKKNVDNVHIDNKHELSDEQQQ